MRQGGAMQQFNHRALCDAAWTGDHHLVWFLVQDADMLRHGDIDTALLHASHRGHHRIVEILLGCGANPLRRKSECLWRAARYGRARNVRLLQPLSDTSEWEAWQWAEIPRPMRRLLGFVERNE